MKPFLDFRKLILDGPGKEAMTQLPLLKQEIIDGVYLRMMGFAKNSYLIRQLHQLQKDSIRLLNVIYTMQEEQHTSAFYTLAQGCLIEILESLQRYKCKYFNRLQAVPLYLGQETVRLLSERLPLLEAGMKKRKIDPTLQTVVLYPFVNFGKKGHSSYQQMEYLLWQVDKLVSLLQSNDRCEESLLSFLLHTGFNTKEFHHFFILKIAAEVHAEYQMDRQFDVLWQYERTLSMMAKKPYRCYDSLVPTTRETLSKFVETEFRHMERKRELSSPKIDRVVEAPSNYRIKTSLSIDSLAYLFRLLIENEAIEANPRTELMAFLALHVKTCGKGEGTVSVNSLTTKYKQVTQSTAIGMRSLLVKMTRQVEADFNL